MSYKFHGFGLDLNSQIASIVNVTPEKEDDNKPVIIYDLDGTLANDDHRKPLVTGKVKDYLKYYSLIHRDTPNWPVIEQLVKDHQGGATIGVITGRPDEYLVQSLRQLYTFQIAEMVNFMLMRPTQLYISSAEYKLQAVSMLVQQGMVVAGFYDDMESVRKAMVEIGIEAFNPEDLIEATKTPKIILPGAGF